MLRDAGGHGCDGTGGGGDLVASGAAVGCEGGATRVGEWSERFFYLSGHFLRYKKQSRNLTSVNLTQTEHVEFNLQSATVETLEEACQREQAAGGEERGTYPRRKYAFRLVTAAGTSAVTAAEDVACSSPSSSAVSMPGGARGGDGGGGGDIRSTRSKTLPLDAASATTATGEAAAAAAAEGAGGGVGGGDGEAGESGGGTLCASCLPGGGGGSGSGGGRVSGPNGKPFQQVWVLAATNSKERSMWMQAIHEAISLGQEFLSQGEEGSLAALAMRMSKELEVRDRHHRLRFYRSCFVGEDAVSWLQSECGPCSVGEALSLGNKMIAAGLIYHCTYGHSLENSRLFYKFADSVMSASKASRGTMPRRASGGGGGTKASNIIGRFGRGLIGGPGVGDGGSLLADGVRPYRSTSDLAAIENGGVGGGGRGGSDDCRSSCSFAAVANERELEGDGGMEGSDDGSASLVSSISGEFRAESVAAEAESEGGVSEGGGSAARGRRDRGAGGDGSCVKRDPVVAAAVSAGRRRVFREVSDDSAGERKILVKRMARELEGLKLTCAEMERSQMRTELQMQAFSTGLVACLETTTDRALGCIAAATALAVFSVALHAQQQLLLQVPNAGDALHFLVPRPCRVEPRLASAMTRPSVIMTVLVFFTLRSFARDREIVLRAVRAAKELCPGGTTPNTGARHGAGNESSGSLPVRHPRTSRARGGQGHPHKRTASTLTSFGKARAGTLADTPPARDPSILARMASNTSSVAPQLAETRDPMSSSSAGPPFPPGLSPSASNASREHRPLTPRASAGADAVASAVSAAPSPVAPAMMPSAASSAAGTTAGFLAQGAGKEGGGRGGGGEGGTAGEGGARPELASLPPEKEWPHHPIFVRLSPSVGGQVRLDGQEPNSSIPVNSDDIAVPFETPLFKGRLLVRVAGLPGDGAQDYFRGKKRLMQCAVQGQFKKELPFNRAYTGQAYLRPFTHLPAKWLIRSAFSVIRRLSPALREDITGDRPYMVSPLAATAQALRAEAPGDEAAIVGDLGEETGLLGASFMNSRVPASARKKFFSNPRNLQAYSYKPGVVYTFDFYQHLYNAVTFELDLGFRRVRLADYLNHQPAQIMALDFETGEMLWNVEIWNAALLKMTNGG
ncbi:unnamed protein product [Scytosiphon promiscuus]